MDLVRDAQVAPHIAAKLEAEAGLHWDLFYRRNRDRFFKDRHYFQREFPELLTAGTVLEVGCGVGNALFPLLELSPHLRAWACDFAPSAIELVKAHPAYGPAAAAGRCSAFVADITSDDLTSPGVGGVPLAGIDACTMVFVLSAISPAAMPAALARVAACLRPGTGRVLFRDYTEGDLAAARLAAVGRQQRLDANFYSRWDGTRSFFFSEDVLQRLFTQQGFVCEYVRVVERVIENRKKGDTMARRWVQAVFRYEGAAAPEAAGNGCDVGAVSTGSSCQQRDHAQQEGREAARQGSSGGLLIARAAAAAQDEAEPPCTEHHVQLGSASLRLRCPAPVPVASQALAQLLLAAGPALLPFDSCVAELACGPAALPSLAVLRWCRRVVATDESPAALGLLRRNAAANGLLFVIERLRLQQLLLSVRPRCREAEASTQRHPQQQQQQQQQVSADKRFAQLRSHQLGTLLSACPSDGYDLVVSAVATEGLLENLAATAAGLLSSGPHALALFCCSSSARCNGSSSTTIWGGPDWPLPPETAERLGLAARPHGLRLVPWPPEVVQAAQAVGIGSGAFSGLTLIAMCRPDAARRRFQVC